MTCSSCHRDSIAFSLVADASGLMVPLCDECSAKPETFAQGTQPGKETLGELRNRDEMRRDVELATARTEACREVLRVLVQAFAREMNCGYATPEQQWALRAAKELIK